MAAKCPLFDKGNVLCRVKAGSRHRWVSTEQPWYIRNYCESDYYVDCEDYEAYLEQQAIVKGKILIVDDEKLLLDTLSAFFGGRGYQVVTALNAEDALKIIEQERPVLAMIDVKLPGMDGLQLLGIIKRRYPALKTFVVTAYDEEHKRAAEDLGADAFFAKPIGLDQLKKRLVSVLADSERTTRTLVASQVLEGAPKAKLLFVLEVLPNEDDRLSKYLRECFSDRSRCGGEYQVEMAHSINEAVEKMMSFCPDLVLINFDSLFTISCGQLAQRVVESPYRPKEVIVYGLNLEAADKHVIEQLGIQYVDQRRTFAKLITTIKQTALRNGLKGSR